MTSNQIAYANYMENVRHNKRTEQISSRNVDVSASQVGLGYANLAEMYRHNYSTEQLTGQQNEIKETEAEAQADNAETKAYEAETRRMETYAKFLPDWLVGLGYGVNELMDSPTGEAINALSDYTAQVVHSNPNRKHRKR